MSKVEKKPTVRPLRRVKPGVARTRDERFELVHGAGCWQVRSIAPGASSLLLSSGIPPECERRQDAADWPEGLYALG